MAVYTNDLRLKEIATGDESGTWGTSTNTNLSLIADAFGFGTEAITTNADTHTTTIADGSADPGRAIFLKYTGTLDSACTITIGPNTVSKLWLIENATSGSQNIIISQGSGANITIANGQTKAIYSDGAGSGAAMVDAFQDLSIPDLFIDDDLTFTSDSAVITFGADGDTTLTHTDGSGLTLNSTNKLMFNDASQFIQGSSATVLSLGATDEIDLTATAIDINGTVDMSSTLAVAGKTTLSLGSSDGTSLELKNTSNVNGSQLTFFNDSSSPADDDRLGQILFNGDDSAGNETTYVRFRAESSDVTDGSEDGKLQLSVVSGGSLVTPLQVGIDGVVVNEFSTSAQDFRVESDSSTHMLFVDAGNNAVLFGKSSLDFSASAGTEIRSDGRIFGGIASSAVMFLNRITDDGDIIELRKDGTKVGSLGINSTRFTIDAPDNPLRVVSGTSNIQINHDTHITLDTAGSERVRVNTSEMVINEDSNNYDFRVEGDSKTHALFVDAGNNQVLFNTSSARTTSGVMASTQIHGTGFNDASLSLIGDMGSSASTAPILFFAKTRGSAGGSTAVQDGDRLGAIFFNGADGTDIDNAAASIQVLVDGTPGSNDMPGRIVFMTTADGTASNTERLRIDNAGQLLHGTTAVPTGVLLGRQSVSSSATGAEIIAFRADTSVSVDDRIGAFLLGNSDTDGTEDHFIGMYGKIASTNGAANLHFVAGRAGYENDDPNMTIKSGGNVGIGPNSTSPNQYLSIIDTSGSNDVAIEFTADYSFVMGADTSNQGNFKISRLTTTLGTNDAFTITRAAGDIGIGTTAPDARVHIMDGDASATSNAGAVLTVENDGDCFIQMLTPNSNSQQLRFGDPQDDGAGSIAYNHNTSTMSFSVNGPTRMSIDSSGSVSMPNLSSGTGNAELRFNTGNGDVTFNTSSRLVKEDIEDISYGLDAVKKLAPKKYKRTDGDKNVEVGFIADEVVEVVPELVGIMKKSVFTEEESDTEEIAGSVHYSQMTAVLVKAIQEQQVLIEALQTKVAALEGGS